MYMAPARTTPPGSRRATWRTSFPMPSTWVHLRGLAKPSKVWSAPTTFSSCWARVTSESWAMSWRKESNLAWLRELPGVRKSEPLATRTSFGIGGAAEYFAEMANPQSIEFALEGCRLRGAGTNLLIADAGLEGLVIRVVNRDYEVDGTRIRAGAGLKMMRLARIAADAGLRGFEFAIGVPGTVGGAVYQNAGCWGHELREVLVEARGFQPGADRRTWSVDDLQFGYRTSALRDGPLRGSLVIDATIQLERGDGEEAKRF